MEQIDSKVYVTYDLAIDTNPVHCHVTLVISGDEGTTFNLYASPYYLEGDIGDNVEVGIGKQIIWDIHQQAQELGTQGIDGEETYRARVIARRNDPDPNDPDAPAGFIYVQGTDGVTFSPGGLGYFNPGGSGGENYNVSLSDFYFSRFEVTQAEYLAVMGINPGSHNSEDGNPLNHPITNVSWFNAIEYCNRRSLQEGLIPAYSYDEGTDYGSNPDDWPVGWNTNDANHTNVSFNWSANGYRLPTEMQREFAARGGVPAQNAGTFNDTYPGTNVAGTGPGQLGDYAWYIANAGPDLPGGSGHPDYGTHPVGTKLPNELGLYDMSGSVFNRVWDIWSSFYPSGSVTDPTGPVSGVHRVGRGGCWMHSSFYCTVSFRVDAPPTLAPSIGGCRVSRIVP